MENRGRRNRRGRPRSRTLNPPYQCNVPMQYVQSAPKCSVFNGFCNFVLLASLIAITYLMLDYQCKICSKKCDVINITKNIDDIALNFTRLKSSYSELEKSVKKFSNDIPKIEGHVEILEALADNIGKANFAWNPRRHFPHVDGDVFLKKNRRSNSEPGR